MCTTDLLVAWLNVTFNHEAFDQFVKFRIDHTAVENFFCNTNLLFILFVGIGVVGINDDSRILQIFFLIFFPQKTEIFVMVVRNRLSVFAYGTAKNGVCQRISSCFNFPASVDKAVRSLSCNNGVEHNTVSHHWSGFSYRQVHPYR